DWICGRASRFAGRDNTLPARSAGKRRLRSNKTNFGGNRSRAGGDRRTTKQVGRFYNQRGTAEQWIKEGKNAVHWTKLSCRRFKDSAARLQLIALAYNLANLLRQLVLHAQADPGLGADDATGEADQDRCQGGSPRQVHHLPPGASRRPEKAVRANP